MHILVPACGPGPGPPDDDPRRTLRLYPWYQGVLGFWFWIPVFFLYFSAHFSLDRVLLLEAIYYAAVVLLEVPSGYFSDVVGRRASLLISALAFCFSYALFLSGSGFVAFVMAQILLAAGYAFNSGSDTALHFDALAALGLEAEYDGREAGVARIGFLAGAIGAVVGGASASWDLRLAYGLSMGSSLILVGIVLAMREPPGEAEESGSALTAGFVGQIGRCLGHLRRPDLAWLFAFAVAFTVLVHIPYEFYQPYLERVAEIGAGSGLGSTWAALPVPLASGLLMAASMLVGSWLSGRSIRIRDRLGTATTLLAGMATLVGLTALMAWFLAPWVVGLLLLRNVGRALTAAPLNAAVTPRIPKAERATYLSLQSLAGRLGFSLTLLVLSGVAGAGAHPSWPELSRLLKLGAGLGFFCLVGLALGVRALKEAPRRAEPR